MEHVAQASGGEVSLREGRLFAMQKISLDALARQQMKLAATAGGRHTADTVHGGHEKVLRQTVIGMLRALALPSTRILARQQCWFCAGVCDFQQLTFLGRPFAGTCSSCPRTAIASRRWRILLCS